MWEAPSHWVVVALIAIALFGYKKLPDAARSLGRSLRIFKTEIKGMSEDDKAREAADRPAGAVTPAEQPPADVTPEPPAATTPVKVDKPAPSGQ
ncbi:Sec-independent protein translocase subunit TatA [Jatrophihabitans cynanchi]|jgi:sec-independent protein translocase protein TatA|uniref:Sec-independent protein translocase protein TatA n=1 Tax=Jatrophihabitans cynanchi TaxID=2944128 RepID=A0ABY7JY04_9ACTN|nr:Sec-independent protein translocase subunit TatA [Jatrophihabitans sp. SB3-54]WAX57445.1 Sec-independent protein translocase subunit TatA [Jatrophihabitans sp. SB3-54]